MLKIVYSLGKVVNKPDHGHLDWVKICEDSSKVITFIDLAGHERYLKTTVFGMTGHLPDFTMLMVINCLKFFSFLFVIILVCFFMLMNTQRSEYTHTQ